MITGESADRTTELKFVPIILQLVSWEISSGFVVMTVDREPYDRLTTVYSIPYAI